jgi:hypothetical protein
MLRSRRKDIRLSRYEAPAASTPIGAFVALAAVTIVAALLIPGSAQAATSVVNAIISDPVKGQARVDVRGNLLVASGFQPVAAEGFVNLTDPDNPSGTKVLYTVPADKRLEIRYVEVIATGNESIATPAVFIGTTLANFQSSWRLDTPFPAPGSSGPGFRAMHGTTQVDLFAAPGTQVVVSVSAQLIRGTIASGFVRFSGVLTDAAAGVPPVAGS